MKRLERVQHFSFYALDGRTGAMRWKHEAGDFSEELHADELLEAWNQHPTPEAVIAAVTY